MKYKAIFFDFDNTLGDRSKSAHQTYKKMLERYTDVKDEVYLEAIIQDCLNYEQFGTYDKNFVIQNINRKYGLNLEFTDFNDYWETHCAEDYVLFDDALDTILRLKEKYRLVIVSNGNHYGQWSKIKKTGIDKYMEFILISSDFHNYNKPDVRLYEEALRRANLKAEEVLFVGDTFSTDILGAYRANINSVFIWADKSRTSTDKITRISKISELCNILL